MATINNKFVFFKSLDSFNGPKGINGATTANSDGYYGNIHKTSIVFIEDTPIIWTHGVTYDVSAGVSSMAIWTKFLAGIDANNPAPSLAEIQSRLEELEKIDHDAYIAADSALKTELQGYADLAEKDAIATAKAYTDLEILNITTGAGYATTKYVDDAVAGHTSAVNIKFEDYSTTDQMNALIATDVLVETNRSLDAEEALGERIDAVSAVAEAATTVGEVNDLIDAKISALSLGTTYEAIGAEERARAYIDTEVAKKQDNITDLETIRGNASAAMTWITSVTEEEGVDSAINKWSEIVDFLAGIEEPDTLDELLNDLRGKISTALGAAEGALTAANNAQTHSEGVASDLSAFKTTASTTYVTLQTVTELTGVVNGKYVKPADGIPFTDLHADVKSALDNANSALQPSAISDMATKTFTEATYLEKGNYATVAQITDTFDPKGSAETAENNAIAAALAMWDWGYPEGK